MRVKGENPGDMSEFAAVLSGDMSGQDGTALRRLLARTRWPVCHVVSQFSDLVSTTTQNSEDKWNAGEERALGQFCDEGEATGHCL